MREPEVIKAPPKSVVRLAVAGLALAVIGLGTLALWAAVVTQDGAANLARAGMQTTGQLRAVQALSVIDATTDALEDDAGDTAALAELRLAQAALDEGFTRMASGSAPEAIRISRAGRPLKVELDAAIERFVAVGADGGEAAQQAEDEMEESIEAIKLQVEDLDSDPAALLASRLESVGDSSRAVRNTAFVLVPLGLLFVAVSGSLLRIYRKRSDEVMQAAMEATASEARTDQLTGVANRRALLEELERRIATGEDLVLVLADLNGFKQYNDTFGHPAGDALLRRLAGRLAEACAGRGAAARLGGDEFCVLIDATSGEQDLRELVGDALSEAGEGFSITASCGSVALPQDAQDADAALRVADARMYAAKAGSRPNVDQLVASGLLSMLDERHPGLGRHVEDVADLAERCALALGLAPDHAKTVHRAAELHDIGKVALPSSILTKPDPLTTEEWEFVRRHTLIGERILAVIPSLQHASQIVRASHERWDGTGYPDHLAGEAIPLEARIVAVADAFCAMTQERPYARARPLPDALDELRASAGTQFDPTVVTAFLSALSAPRQTGETPALEFAT